MRLSISMCYTYESKYHFKANDSIIIIAWDRIEWITEIERTFRQINFSNDFFFLYFDTMEIVKYFLIACRTLSGILVALNIQTFHIPMKLLKLREKKSNGEFEKNFRNRKQFVKIGILDFWYKSSSTIHINNRKQQKLVSYCALQINE